MTIRNEKENLIKTRCILAQNDGSRRRVFCQTWPRTAENRTYPKESSVFVVVDVNSSELYIAEARQKDKRLDLNNLEIICVKPGKLFPELVFKAHKDYFEDKVNERIIPLEELYKEVLWDAR